MSQDITILSPWGREKLHFSKRADEASDDAARVIIGAKTRAKQIFTRPNRDWKDAVLLLLKSTMPWGDTNFGNQEVAPSHPSVPLSVRSKAVERSSELLKINVGGLHAFVVVPEKGLYLTVFDPTGQLVARKQFRLTNPTDENCG
jgi:hypothetical protein